MKNTLLLIVLLFQITIAGAQIKKFLIPFRQGNHWGFSDTSGKIIIQPQYDGTDFLVSNEMIRTDVGAIITKKGQGIISFNGKIVVPAEYEHVAELKGNYVVQKNSKQGLYNANGKLVVPVKYDEVFNADYRGDCIHLLLNQKIGLYMPSLHLIIPAVYDNINDEFYSDKVDNQKYFFAKKGSERYLIDRRTGKISPYKDDEDLGADAIEMMKMEDTGYYGTENTEKDLVKKIRTSFELDEVEPYLHVGSLYASQSKMYQVKKNGKLGLALPDATLLLAPIYDSISYVLILPDGSQFLKYRSSYLIAVRKGNYFGLINEKGEEILPFQYDVISALPKYWTGFLTDKDHKKGIFLPYTVYPPLPNKYDSIDCYGHFNVTEQWSFLLFKVSVNGKPGYVGENGVEYFSD
jgi:hypothetical protein